MIDSARNRGGDVDVPPAPADGPPSGRWLTDWASAFFENAPSPLAIIRAAGHCLLYTNQAFRQLHSLAATANGLPVSDLFDRSIAHELEALVDRSIASRSGRHEATITDSGGKLLQCAAWPLIGENVADLLLVMVETRPATDIATMRAIQVGMTERLLLSALRDQMLADTAAAAEQKAELANAAKDRFLTTMSHELRTPLNAIGGYAELIEMGLRGPVTPEQREDLTRIQRAQEHLLGLINSVLNYAKIESRTVSYELTPVRLDSTLDAVQEMLKPHLDRQRLTYRTLVDTTPGGGPPMVSADPEKLRQIFINVLTNAIKFTAPGGTIRTWYEIGDRTIAVHIGDTGRGIPEDQLATIFTPFVQVGRRLNSGDQGIGLGLAISRDLARGMGGELTAISTPGSGSTFTLTLARAAAGVQRGAGPAGDEPPRPPTPVDSPNRDALPSP
jgi:signal transduction histidine kinase